jgi:hypothetical protein
VVAAILRGRVGALSARYRSASWAGRLDELDDTTLVLVQPGSLAATFEGFHRRFGDGFDQRSQEAIKLERGNSSRKPLSLILPSQITSVRVRGAMSAG